MVNHKAKILLHPVRMRIIQTLANGEERTVYQIAEMLGDIPQATLYRHLNTLVKEQILIITNEKKIRGAVEKTYKLAENGALITAEELKNVSKEEHMKLFMTFLSKVIGDFSMYLEKEEINLEKDRVGYRQMSLHLSDEELNELMMEFRAALQKVLHHKPTSDRTEYHFSTILIPEVNKKK